MGRGGDLGARGDMIQGSIRPGLPVLGPGLAFRTATNPHDRPHSRRQGLGVFSGITESGPGDATAGAGAGFRQSGHGSPPQRPVAGTGGAGPQPAPGTEGRLPGDVRERWPKAGTWPKRPRNRTARQPRGTASAPPPRTATTRGTDRQTGLHLISRRSPHDQRQNPADMAMKDQRSGIRARNALRGRHPGQKQGRLFRQRGLNAPDTGGGKHGSALD